MVNGHSCIDDDALGAWADGRLSATEVEALALEYSWIKEFDPRFNVKYRDDKSYPYLAVTVSEEFPRVTVMRGAQRKGVRYFGPYGHAWAIRDTVDTLLRVFPMRSCSQGVFRRAAAIGRPCLLGDIGKCAAPCVGRVTADEHRAIVDDVRSNAIAAATRDPRGKLLSLADIDQPDVEISILSPLEPIPAGSEKEMWTHVTPGTCPRFQLIW